MLNGCRTRQGRKLSQQTSLVTKRKACKNLKFIDFRVKLGILCYYTISIPTKLLRTQFDLVMKNILVFLLAEIFSIILIWKLSNYFSPHKIDVLCLSQCQRNLTGVLTALEWRWLNNSLVAERSDWLFQQTFEKAIRLQPQRTSCKALVIYLSSSSEAVKMWLGRLKYIGIDENCG